MGERHKRFQADVETASDERLACALDQLEFLPRLNAFGRWQRRAISSELEMRNG